MSVAYSWRSGSENIVVFFVAAGFGDNGGAIRGAQRQATGQILLNSHVAVQTVVVTLVGNTKTADAEDAGDFVSFNACAGRQCAVVDLAHLVDGSSIIAPAQSRLLRMAIAAGINTIAVSSHAALTRSSI